MKLIKLIYNVLKARPFSKECINEEDIYDAYCQRIAETISNELEGDK